MLKEFLNMAGVSDIRDFCFEKGQIFEVRKDDFFFRRGEVPKYVGFIKKGAFRYIDYTTAGKIQIVGYSFQNDFVSDYGSFQTQTQSGFYAQAINDSTVYAVTREELNQFYDNHKDSYFRSKIAESVLTEIDHHFISLYRDTPEERYMNLTERYPELLNLVSLKEIASFVGVTPETLSRIRGKKRQ